MLEFASVSLSLISVFLIVKNSLWAWPIGIISNILYGILFVDNKIWGNALLQVVFIIQSAYCWYNWNKPNEYPIAWMKTSGRYQSLGAFGLLFLLVFGILHLSAGEKLPYLDAITTSLCIMGMILLAYRKIENWLYWMCADALFIGFFFLSGLYILSASYIVFFSLATSGFITWRKKAPSTITQ